MLLSAKFLQMLNLQDCCHEINLALLHINELDEFSPVRHSTHRDTLMPVLSY